MTIILKAKEAWSTQRLCWRLDIQYQDVSGASKRTFVQIPDAEEDKARGASAAARAGKDFRKGVGPLYGAFMAKVDGAKRPVPVVKPKPSPMKVRKGPKLDISWLLDRCLEHPQIWGAVKHSKNYISGVRKLNALIGHRLVSEFEAPHGRKLVMEVVHALRGEGHSDGYIRKLAYQLRQALGAAIGQSIDEPIGDPVTGEQLLRDIPTFPALPKSKSRTATLDRDHDQIVFEIIRARFERAREEERAYMEKMGSTESLGVGAVGRVEVGNKVVWLNSRRFSSVQWMVFERYIRFLIETGCRKSEALSVGNHSVRWRETTGDLGEVVERYQVLHLPAEVTKGAVDRTINLTPTLLAALPFWEGFARPHSFKIGDRTITRDRAWFPLSPTQITHMWAHVRGDAKSEFRIDLSDVSPHNLRHTHATRMSARGMSGKPLSDSLGHADERTTRIYDHSVSVDQSRKYFARNVSAGG